MIKREDADSLLSKILYFNGNFYERLLNDYLVRAFFECDDIRITITKDNKMVKNYVITDRNELASQLNKIVMKIY